MSSSGRRSVFVDGLSHGPNPVPMAAVHRGMLSTGGIPGVDRATGRMPDEFRDEVTHAFDNLVAVLRAGGADLDDVLRLDVLLLEPPLRPVMNEEWVRRFPDPATRPARKATFGGGGLPSGLRIQLQCLAVLPEA